MTHLDVYDTFEEIKACIAYRIGDKIVENFPASNEDLNKAKPVLRTFPGWKKSLKDSLTYEDFPEAAMEYIEFVERYCETPIDVVSVGYDRKATIIRKSPWLRK
jgi:adenylosuccinate synthase